MFTIILYLFSAHIAYTSTTTVPLISPHKPRSKEIIVKMVIDHALSHHVDPAIALQIVRDESGFNQNAVGDHGTSFGISQIHLPAHPEISKSQALDPEFAAEYLASELEKGHCRIWSTCKPSSTD